MRAELKQFEALYWISHLGSFRAAAEHLHITQPAISVRIQELERALNAELFDRSSYRAKLTAKGRDFVQFADRLHRLGMAIEQRCRQDGALWGTIRLGVCDSFALTCLPELLKQIEHRFPEVRLELDIDHSVKLEDKLQKRQIDAAFLTQATPVTGLVVENLAALELGWVANPRLGLPDRPLQPIDLQAVPILTTPRASLLHRDITEWFEAAAVEPTRISTCNSLSIMVRLATSGYGIALLPIAIIDQELQCNVLRLYRSDLPIARHHLRMAYTVNTTGPDLTVIRDLARPIIASSVLMAGQHGSGPSARRRSGRTLDSAGRRESFAKQTTNYHGQGR
jgi:DNA-binding transcriptional LysR family regulator